MLAEASAPYTEMSVDLLSQQPANVPYIKEPREDKDWGIIFTHLESRMSALRSWRWASWAYWNRLAQFFLPRRHLFFVTANRMWRGSPINDSIIDSTGLTAVRTCAAGLWTGLTSPSRPWFKLGIALPWLQLDAEGQAWLEDTEQRLYTVFAQSNFYTTMAQAFQDVVVFGNAPVIMYEDQESVIRCYLPCAGEYFLGLGSRLMVDTLYREFTMTIAQIVEMFKLENCPSEIQKMWSSAGGNLDVEYVVCHSIEPNIALSKRGAKSEVRAVPESFAFWEFYWLKGNKCDRPLSRRGFKTAPFMVARWATQSNDAYARSLCMDCLGDNMQVQQETRRKAEFIEKLVRPPMGANPELKNEPSSITPGNVTYTSTEGGKKGFWPLFEVNASALQPMVEDIKEVNARIQHTLFVDTFMAITRMEGVQPRNELELTKRDLERLQDLGPFIQQFEVEFAGLAIARAMDILERRGLLKPKPKSLDNVPLKVSYISIMKLAQKSAESVAIKDVLSTMGALSSAAKAANLPDPLRVISLDKAARVYAELNNFPTSALFTEKEVMQHDAIRTKAAQAAQAPQQAMAAVTAAHTLSQTSMPNGSTALGALLGGQGGGAGGGAGG